MSRQRRHLVIADILGAATIASQDELRLALAGRGVEVTQATLSRDLRAMGVLKTPSGYRVPGEGVDAFDPVPGRFRPELVADFVASIVVAGQMVIVKTGPGRAQAVAYEIDLHPPRGALGTVAGDDTIFVCAADAEMAAELGAWFGDAFGVVLTPSEATPASGGVA